MVRGVDLQIRPSFKGTQMANKHVKTKEAVNSTVEDACAAAEAVLRGTITSATFRSTIRAARDAASEGFIIRNVRVYRAVSDLLAAWEKFRNYEKLSRRKSSGITEESVAALRNAALRQVAITRETIAGTPVIAASSIPGLEASR